MEWFDSDSNLANFKFLNLESHLIISPWETISRYIVGKKGSDVVYFGCFHVSSKKVRNDAYHLPWWNFKLCFKVWKEQGSASFELYCEQDKCPS